MMVVSPGRGNDPALQLRDQLMHSGNTEMKKRTGAVPILFLFGVRSRISAFCFDRTIFVHEPLSLIGERAWVRTGSPPPGSLPPVETQKRPETNPIFFQLVPAVGIEPTWSCPRRILRAFLALATTFKKSFIIHVNPQFIRVLFHFSSRHHSATVRWFPRLTGTKWAQFDRCKKQKDAAWSQGEPGPFS